MIDPQTHLGMPLNTAKGSIDSKDGSNTTGLFNKTFGFGSSRNISFGTSLIGGAFMP